MTDGEVTWSETKDPAACNTDDPINYYKVSRDPARTPFHWNDGKNAGFTNGSTTWLPVAKNYKEVNLAAQTAAARSHYKVIYCIQTFLIFSIISLSKYIIFNFQFYKDLVSLKRNTTLVDGDLELKVITSTVLAILR